MRNIINRISFLLLTISFLGIASGQSHADNIYEITDSRIVSTPSSNIKIDATSPERFGFKAKPSNTKDQNNTPLPLQWHLPEGWQELPTTSMRMVNLRVASHQDSECYLSILPGRAGGIMENINRWRQQMSLPPLSNEKIASLPKKKLFSRDAVYIECDGTFVGMRNNTEKKNYRLAGMILEHSAVTIFVKMVGPKRVLEPEMEEFYNFCSSLRVTPETVVESSDKDEISSPQVSDTAKLSWEAPQAWIQGPKRAMRLVTFQTTPNSQTECYVSVFPGSVGGVLKNVNRWRHQMELSELDSVAIEKLPVLPILGQEAKLIEIKGNYTGMSDPTQKDFMMLGLICSLSDQTLFIKMIGPEVEVLSERENFLKFCQSLKFL